MILISLPDNLWCDIFSYLTNAKIHLPMHICRHWRWLMLSPNGAVHQSLVQRKLGTAWLLTFGLLDEALKTCKLQSNFTKPPILRVRDIRPDVYAWNGNLRNTLAPAIWVAPVDRQVGRCRTCVHWRPTDSYEALVSGCTRYSRGIGKRSRLGPLGGRPATAGLGRTAVNVRAGVSRWKWPPGGCSAIKRLGGRGVAFCAGLRCCWGPPGGCTDTSVMDRKAINKHAAARRGRGSPAAGVRRWRGSPGSCSVAAAWGVQPSACALEWAADQGHRIQNSNSL
jgi:hypothetical protein